jgi:hypothetical protein
MLSVLSDGLVVDEDIVKENQDKVSKVGGKDVVHQLLKCCRSI